MKIVFRALSVWLCLAGAACHYKSECSVLDFACTPFLAPFAFARPDPCSEGYGASPFYRFMGNSHTTRAVCATPSGMYVGGTGATLSTLDGLPPVGSFAGGLNDIILTKHDRAGVTQAWTFFGGSGNDQLFALRRNTRGEIFLLADSDTNFTWNGQSPLLAHSGGGVSDLLVAKLSPDLQVIWFTFLGGAGVQNSGGIAPSADGGLLVTGTTAVTFSIPSASPVQGFQGGIGDGIVFKLAANGALEWYTFVGGTTTGETLTGGVVDQDGYTVAGYGSNPITSMSGILPDVPGTGLADGFVIHLSPSGSLDRWTNIGGTLGDQINTIVPMPGGYAVGGFTNSTSIQTRTSVTTTTAGQQMLIARLDARYNLLWYSSPGGTDNDTVTALAGLPSGGIAATGSCTGSGCPPFTIDGLSSLTSWQAGLADAAFTISLSAEGRANWFHLVGELNSAGRSIRAYEDGYVLTGIHPSSGTITSLQGVSPTVAFTGSPMMLMRINQTGYLR